MLGSIFVVLPKQLLATHSNTRLIIKFKAQQSSKKQLQENSWLQLSQSPQQPTTHIQCKKKKITRLRSDIPVIRCANFICRQHHLISFANFPNKIAQNKANSEDLSICLYFADSLCEVFIMPSLVLQDTSIHFFVSNTLRGGG